MHGIAIKNPEFKLWIPRPFTPNKVPRGREIYDQDAYNMHDLLKENERVD